jgi:pilus assembly protein CpaB
MTRRILPLLLAIVLAGLGTAAVLAYVVTADARALKGKEAVTVLLALKKIPAGTTAGQVRSGDFVEQVRMPADAVPKDALGSVGAELDSLIITSDLMPRQMLLRGQFGPEKKTVVGLPVPEGKIAMSIQLSTVAGVAGYVIPGSKITVFDTFNIGTNGKDPSGDRLAERYEYNRATKVLLPTVDVIAVGTFGVDGKTDVPAPAAPAKAEEEGSGAIAPQSTGLLMVTVAVTQAEAEKLVHGAQTGSLYLGLLNETSVVKRGAGVENNSLFK